MAFHSATDHRISKVHWTYRGHKIPLTDPEAIDNQLLQAAENLPFPETGINELPLAKGFFVATFRTALSLREFPKYVEFVVRMPNGSPLLVWNAILGYSIRSEDQAQGRLFFRMNDLEGKGACLFMKDRAELTLHFNDETFHCDWEVGDSTEAGWSYPVNMRNEVTVQIKSSSKDARLNGKDITQTFFFQAAPILALYPSGKWTWNPIDLLRRWVYDTYRFCEYEETFLRIFREEQFLAIGAVITGLCAGTALPRPVDPFGGPP